nr:MAG TPA: hypothetical protein [Caudoviricetes sp.]
MFSSGNLRNGSNAGPWYVNGRNWSDRANWNICSRLSGCISFIRRVLPPPSFWRRAGLTQLN